LLLGEGYLMSTANETRDWLATWRPAQQLYYRLPSAWRSRVQKRMIRGLDDKLAQQPADQFATRYPIDAIGWLLLRAIRNLIRLTGGDALPSVDPWPNGSRACVVVSQDIEPTRYAYRHGLPRLLNWLQAEGTPPHTINVVGNEARREPKLWNRSKFTHNEVGCHGWLHDGREARLPRASMIEYFDRARNVIESLHGVPVTTFRSPRLDRSPSLYEALEICGFTCDSTIPDVDRENTHRWGGGCSFNFPFHPVVAAGPDWRQLDLLECPVTAPDCAMPVFAGGTEAEAIALYSRKLDWIEAIGGCAVAIFHGGVFDDEDAGLRQRLLAGYYRSLAGRNVWRATLRELEKWWRIRQSLHASVSDGAVTLANRGSSHSFPVRLSWRGTSWMVPALAPGTSWSSATLESCAVEARVH